MGGKQYEASRPQHTIVSVKKYFIKKEKRRQMCFAYFLTGPSI